MKLRFSQDTDYWLHKTRVFLHDPPDKAIHIPGHEERANAVIAALGMAGVTLDHDEYKKADIIASGMDRATLPGYAANDETRSGAVDFFEFPQITHPTGADQALGLKISTNGRGQAAFVREINQAICELIKRDMGTKAGSGKGLSERPEYRGDEEKFAPARFHYLYFLLRRRLAKENVGGLGGLWHRLPADTRIPDHSIWQHSGLTSALASSMRLSDENRASLMVYAITPVQDFVGQARKLRDFWSGSIILSWLAFEGIRAVIQLYGADHVIYPSLHGQPLVDDMLRRMGMPDEWLGSGQSSGVASFPNKFVILVPTGKESETAGVIEEAVSASWRELGEATLAMTEETVKRQDAYIRQQFDRQLGSYWEHHWAAASLVNRDDRTEIEELLHRGSVEKFFTMLEQSNDLLRRKDVVKTPPSGESALYSVTHRLAQAMLAAGKSHRHDRRGKEAGIKCDMFGEFEIIHYSHESGGDKNPKPSEDPFWADLRRSWKPESDFGPSERLCALGLVKRLAYRVCQKMDGHPLARMFQKADSFPSTTEVAMTDWWNRLRARASDQDSPEAVSLAEELAVFEFARDTDKSRRALAQWFHELDEPDSRRRQGDAKEQLAAAAIFKKHPVGDVHKYYAVLMMDGDRMGKLVNGDTLGAVWASAMHPELARRLQGSFDPDFKRFWEEWLGEKRIISPAVHAAISEALGDFSLHTVPFVIREKHQGRLIYAGGDDVCAVLPVSNVLDAAREIAAAYTAGFVGIVSGRRSEVLDGKCDPAGYDKIGVHLGKGEGISISAGIMVAHHKKPLGRVIRRAHELLDMAKRAGRNGFVLEMDKRSGGGRIFRARWDTPGYSGTKLDSFLRVADALQEREKAALSSSLAYRLDTFMDGMLALDGHDRNLMVAFIRKQLERSGLAEGTEEKELAVLAAHVSALLSPETNEKRLPTESLIVANFIGHCRRERRNGGNRLTPLAQGSL